MPHLRKLLRECRQARLRLGIISNAQFYTPFLLKWLVGAALTDFGFSPELILWSYRWGHAKPSPVLFETARERLAGHSIPPHHVLYVGNDMRYDILPAQQAGFQTALFAGDARSLRWRRDDARCRRHQPDLVITDLRQLLDYLPEPR
jgi:putative hydrolase of the HAD superfamily